MGAGGHAGRHRHLRAGADPERLHQIGGELRRGIEKVVADAGLSSYFQLRGRDCNLVYVARDRAGQPSQAFRTLVLQELIDRGILAPSFVVCAAHDPAAIRQTVDAVAELMPAYQRAWSPASITSFAVGQSGLPYARADSDSEKVPDRRTRRSGTFSQRA